MKIKRKDLVDVMARVKPGLSSKEIIEQSSHFIFDGDTIRTNNDRVTITEQFECPIQGAVQADQLYAFLNKLTEEEIHVEYDDGLLEIKAGKTKAEIRVDEEIKLPSIDLSKLKRWNKLPEDFNQAMSFCSFSASKNMIVPALTCLYIKDDLMLSCDNFRATKWKMKSKVKDSFLLPADSASDLFKYSPGKYILDNGWIHFSVNDGKTIFSCRTIGGQYPEVILDYFDIKGKSVFLPDGFEKIIERVSVFCQEDFEKDYAIELKFNKGAVTVYAEGIIGKAQELCKIDFKDELSVKVHPQNFVEILKYLKEMIICENSLLFKTDNFDHIVLLID